MVVYLLWVSAKPEHEMSLAGMYDEPTAERLQAEWVALVGAVQDGKYWVHPNSGAGDAVAAIIEKRIVGNDAEFRRMERYYKTVYVKGGV